MSSFGRLLKFFKDKVPFSARMPTVLAVPKRTRKYADIKLTSVPTYTQMSPPPADADTIVLTGITKYAVLLQLEYRDYMCKKTNVFEDRPEFVEKCYDLMATVNADKPVKKEFLLELCPELFPAAILQSHLSLPLKEHYKDLITGGPEAEKRFFAENTQIVPYSPHPKPLTEVQKAKDGEFQSPLGKVVYKSPDEPIDFPHFLTTQEIDNRRIFIWQETKDTFGESEQIIRKYTEKFGNVYSALDYITLKGDQRTPEEQKVIDGMTYITTLMEKHEEYKDNVSKYLRLRPMLPFPMPEYLKKMYLERISQVWQECYVPDITDVMGIPDKSAESQKEIDMKYQRAIDLEKMSEKDRKEALKLIEDKGDELIVRRDLNAKDQALISKMNLLANTIEIKKIPDIVPDYSKSFDPEALRFKLRKQMDTEVAGGLLSPENMVKVLYLNNARPQEFDLQYWAEVFNLEPQKIRNIFNHVSYPVIVREVVVGRLAFIEIPRKKTIIDLEEENLKHFQSQQRSSS